MSRSSIFMQTRNSKNSEISVGECEPP